MTKSDKNNAQFSYSFLLTLFCAFLLTVSLQQLAHNFKYWFQKDQKIINTEITLKVPPEKTTPSPFFSKTSHNFTEISPNQIFIGVYTNLLGATNSNSFNIINAAKIRKEISKTWFADDKIPNKKFLLLTDATSLLTTVSTYPTIENDIKNKKYRNFHKKFFQSLLGNEIVM